MGFTEVAAFSEGKTWVNKGEKYAFIDSNGLFITEFKYDVVGGFENGFATVSVDSLYGFINAEGIEITALKYDRVRNFKGGFADVQLDDLWGLIDSSGTETIDPVADLPLIRLEQNYVAMKYRGYWGVTDFKGKIVIPFTYDCILPDATAYKGSVRLSLSLQQIVK